MMAAHADMGDAFIVPTSRAVRDYLRTALRGALEHYDRLVLPCAGRLAIAETAIDAGWRPGEIQCSDINLFSSVLGYMAGGMDMAALGIAFPLDDEESEWARAKAEAGNHAAAVFMLMKLAQMRPTSHQDRMVRQELWANRDRYGNQFEANARRLAAKLHGLDYAVGDVFEAATDVVEDPRALIYVDPWHPQDDRAFWAIDRSVTWNAPAIAPYDANSGTQKLHFALMPANALALFHSTRTLPEGAADKAVYVVERGANTREHIYCNRPDEARRLVKPRTPTEIEASTIPVLAADHKIGPDAVVQLMPAEKVQALYYADLWGYALDGRMGQSFFVLIDGMIAAVIGINFAEIRQSRGPWVILTYCHAAPNVHADLDGLIAGLLVTRDALAAFEAVSSAPLMDVAELRVPCVSPRHDVEQWTKAGLLLKTRQHRADTGMWYLHYHGEFSRQTFADSIDEWLDRQSESPHDGVSTNAETGTRAET